MNERIDLILSETAGQLDRILNAFVVGGDQSDDFPNFDRYAIISEDFVSNEKCLIGINITDPNLGTTSVTILKQTNVSNRFEFTTTISEEMKSYWDEYGCDYDTSNIQFYVIDNELYAPDNCPYGFEVIIQEIDWDEDNIHEEIGVHLTWGDSNYPGIGAELVSKTDAEAFYNS